MKKNFGNVKGFEEAIIILSTQERSDLLQMMMNKNILHEAVREPSKCPYDKSVVVLATIYHFNNGDE